MVYEYFTRPPPRLTCQRVLTVQKVFPSNPALHPPDPFPQATPTASRFAYRCPAPCTPLLRSLNRPLRWSNDCQQIAELFPVELLQDHILLSRREQFLRLFENQLCLILCHFCTF